MRAGRPCSGAAVDRVLEIDRSVGRIGSARNCKSLIRSVKLSTADGNSQLSRRWVLLVCLVLDTLMSLTTLIVLICVRELYSSDTGYNRYDWPGQNEDYTIQPRYFDPPLPGLNANSTYNGWEPNDNEFRVYRSPLHYNPLNCEYLMSTGSLHTPAHPL